MITSGRTQRRLLWVCLGSIALCAVVGVASLLFDIGGAVNDEIMISTIFVGLAALMALPAAAAAERGRWSPLGPLALLLIGMGLIWTLSLVWLTGPWALEDGALVGILAAIVMCDGLALIAALTCAISLARLRRGARWLLPFSITTMLTAALCIWYESGGSKWDSYSSGRRVVSAGYVAVVLIVAVPVAIVWAGRMGFAVSRGRSFAWVVGTLALPLLMLIVGSFFESGSSFVFSGRVFGAAMIASITGLIAVGVMHRMTTIARQETVYTTRLDLRLFCPRCGSDQTLPAGHCSCKQCGLKMRIEIEEEQCGKCGYVLFGIASANCPECGVTIAGSPSPAGSDGVVAAPAVSPSVGGA